MLNIEHGVFTPLVFGTNGGMGRECQMFVKHLATLLAEKTGDKYSDTVTWLRTRISMDKYFVQQSLVSEVQESLLRKPQATSEMMALR